MGQNRIHGKGTLFCPPDQFDPWVRLAWHFFDMPRTEDPLPKKFTDKNIIIKTLAPVE